MIDESELSRLVREALPPRTASASLHEWARAEARRRAAEPAAVAAEDYLSMRPRRRRARWWMGDSPSRAAAALLVAVSLGAAGGFVGHAIVSRSVSATAQRQALAGELLDAHLGSLRGDHLMDVRSTDQHTVKPWFAGRVDFAPHVVDLDTLGFPLLGGRLAYVDGHEAAVLVYGRRKHVIDLFIWRDDRGSDRPPASTLLNERGYSLVHWSLDGLTYWAVSDAAGSELEAFRAAYLASMPRPPTRQ